MFASDRTGVLHVLKAPGPASNTVSIPWEKEKESPPVKLFKYEKKIPLFGSRKEAYSIFKKSLQAGNPLGMRETAWLASS